MSEPVNLPELFALAKKATARKAGYPCPTGNHKGGRCCIACDHDTEGVECVCIEIMDECREIAPRMIEMGIV